MSKTATKIGKGGKRKIGRSGRKPSHNRYVLEGRSVTNKARKAARIKKIQEKKAARKAKKAAETAAETAKD